MSLPSELSQPVAVWREELKDWRVNRTEVSEPFPGKALEDRGLNAVEQYYERSSGSQLDKCLYYLLRQQPRFWGEVMAPETETIEARNKAIVLDAMDRISRNDPTVYEEHPGFFETQRIHPRLMGAFPDWTVRVESAIAEGDRVAFLGWATGTHHGDFAGIPATGKSVTYQVVAMDRLKDGKIVQHNASPDMMAVLVQLGALPLKPPGS